MENTYLIINSKKHISSIDQRSPFFPVKSYEDYTTLYKKLDNIALESSSIRDCVFSDLDDLLDFITINIGFCRINIEELLNEIRLCIDYDNYEFFIICEKKTSANISAYTMLYIKLKHPMKNRIMNFFGFDSTSSSVIFTIHHGSYFNKN
jgi:hypothetical protein